MVLVVEMQTLACRGNLSFFQGKIGEGRQSRIPAFSVDLRANLRRRISGKAVPSQEFGKGLRSRARSLRNLTLAASEPSSPTVTSLSVPASAAQQSDDGDDRTEDLRMIEEIKEVLALLKERRDMTIEEIRLTVMIEDPREAERRRQLDVENESGVSGDDIGTAFSEITKGIVPEDSLAIAALHNIMISWPNLDSTTFTEEEEVLKSMGRTRKEPSPYEESSGFMRTAGGKAATVGATAVATLSIAESAPMTSAELAARRASAAWDSAGEIEEPLGENVDSLVPPVVGYSFLYLLSGIPILIGVSVVVILFVNSLQ